ncbi:hypothetical protein DFH29DRAFT_1051410 [Suillus ampliporus]|nr:hypothetical protein DFH29DRAFT_1051410 [Suillus ampliporus]
MKRQSAGITVEAQKPRVRTGTGRTRTEMGSTGLGVLGTAKSRGSKDKGKGKEENVNVDRDEDKCEDLDTVEEDEEELAQMTHECELSMQVSPRRPMAPTWVPSPLRPPQNTFPIHSDASGAYELFRGPIADITLIFSGGEFGSDYPYETQTYNDERLAELSNVGYDQQTGDAHEKKPNIYFELFEEMPRTLVETEGHLFNISELDYVDRYTKLSPSAKFLMTKLILPKFNAWHRLDSLKYEAEIGSTDGVVQAIDEVCSVPVQVKEGAVEEGGAKMDIEKKDIIDLMLNDDVYPPPSLPSHILQSKIEEVPIPLDAILSATNAIAEPVGILAEDESQMNLPTLLECLKVDELRCIAKQMRVKASLKKPDMIHALLIGSCTQSTLVSFAYAMTKSKMKSSSTTPIVTPSTTLRQTILPFGRETAQKRLRDLVLQILGKTQPSQGLLLPALLSWFKKCSYARVAFTRTKKIWPTRKALLAYKQALEQEELVDTALARNFAAAGAERDFKTPAADGPLFKMPVTPNTVLGVPQTPTVRDDCANPYVKYLFNPCFKW